MQSEVGEEVSYEMTTELQVFIWKHRSDISLVQTSRSFHN